MSERYCRDCAHYLPEPATAISQCWHATNAPISLVTGKREPIRNAAQLRDADWSNKLWACGPEGRNWEPRAVEPKGTNAL